MCDGAWCVHLDLLPGYYSNHTHRDTRCTVLLYRYEVVVCTVHTLCTQQPYVVRVYTHVCVYCTVTVLVYAVCICVHVMCVYVRLQ